MRLTCPNCDAQYEVDDNAIPESGRDVQCSNCGHAWFQLPPDIEEQLRDEARTFGDPAPGAAAEPAPEPEPAPQPTPAPAADSVPPAPAAPRRELDAGLRSLLREEAERETAARRAEGTIETQPDLGLDEPSASQPSPEATKRRIERLMDEQDGAAQTDDANDHAAAADPIEDAQVETVAGPRRDLLPDIEEINSTLRANSERGANEPGASADAETPAEARRGFRRGFLMVLLIAVILALLYIYAPKIAQKVPAAAGPLTSYVQTVDKGRLWLDRMMEKATSAINGSGGDGAGN